jgi:hypothetical protein
MILPILNHGEDRVRNYAGHSNLSQGLRQKENREPINFARDHPYSIAIGKECLCTAREGADKDSFDIDSPLTNISKPPLKDQIFLFEG